VAEPARCQIRKIGSFQDAQPCLRQSAKRPIARSTRKNKLVLLWQISKQLGSGTAERVNTLSLLAIGET
jgi:hypothetical protein